MSSTSLCTEWDATSKLYPRTDTGQKESHETYPLTPSHEIYPPTPFPWNSMHCRRWGGGEEQKAPHHNSLVTHLGKRQRFIQMDWKSSLGDILPHQILQNAINEHSLSSQLTAKTLWTHLHRLYVLRSLGLGNLLRGLLCLERDTALNNIIDIRPNHSEISFRQNMGPSVVKLKPLIPPNHQNKFTHWCIKA